MRKQGSILSTAMLLAGSAIGTGFYAIPIAAGPAGFYPTLIMTVAVFLYMFATGLLYLEAILACPDGGNIISISKRLIGKTGMVIAAISFIMTNVFYLTNLIFLSGDFFNYFFQYWLQLDIPKDILSLIVILFFGGVVFLGTYVSDRVNFLLFAGLLVAFFGTVFLEAHNVRLENLSPRVWYLVVFSVPFIITAIDYHAILPTLSTYLKRDSSKLVRMIFLALLFPLILYSFWIWLTIGSTPAGALWEAYEQKKPIIEGFLLLRGGATFKLFFHFTSLFAITTSLIGVGLAGTDFLSDAFNIPVEKRVGTRRLLACGVVFLTGFLLTVILYPQVLSKMDYLVGFSEIVFTGAIPIWLAVRARYILNLDMKHILPGKKWLIITLGIVTFFLIYLEGIQVLGEA